MSRPRIATYLYSPEWVTSLVDKGWAVDLALCYKREVWPHVTHEWPDHTRFMENLQLAKYVAVVVPRESDDTDPVVKEMYERFKALSDSTGIPGVVGMCSPESVSVLSRPAVSSIRIKRRIPMQTHPVWVRHCHAVIHSLTNGNTAEPEGSLMEIDCGDGALIFRLMDRFSKLDCVGLARMDEEKEAARRVNPKAPIGLMDEHLDKQCADYMICTDCFPDGVDQIRKVIAGNARKMGIMTINKGDEDRPDVNTIRQSFSGWSVNETPSHYVMVLEKKT